MKDLDNLPVIYSTKTCAFCNVQKQWFDSKDVNYKVIDIEENKEAAKRVEELTGRMAVPVTVIGDIVIQGFNRPKLTEALGL